MGRDKEGNMITNKDKVLEFVIEYNKECNSIDEETIKFDTNFIADKTNILRSNVSTILNQLVSEGKIVKYAGRPVLYSLSETYRKQMAGSDFKNLIGYEDSLAETIQFSKAAMTYPVQIPRILFVGSKGVGISSISENVYRFACENNLIKSKASYCEFDCLHFSQEALEAELSKENNIFVQNNGGLLLLKNADALPIHLVANLLCEYGSEQSFKLLLIVHIRKEKNIPIFSEYFNFVSSIPSLERRSLKERYQFVELFFQREAAKLNCRIKVNYGLMQCLLLYPCQDNLTELEKNIQFGVANANLRSREKQTITLDLSDLPINVRKGLLRINKSLSEIDTVLIKDNTYIFESEQTFHVHNDSKNLSIYQRLDNKQKLLGKSINSKDLNQMLFANIESDLHSYLDHLTEDYDDFKLENQISEKLRKMVRAFVNQAGQQFNKVYSNKIFYGICLHLNNALVIAKPKQRISNEKIIEIMELYNEEYVLSRKFIHAVQESFNVTFSRDEIIFITLFIALDFEVVKKESDVVTLIAMHGSSTARSIQEVVSHLIPVNNCESFDLLLDEDVDTSYEKLKKKIIQINRGKGVMVIYDMGSIQIMLNSIMEETNIEIRYLEMPITLLVMSSCHYSEEGKSVDEIHHLLTNSFINSSFSRNMSKDIIIVLSKKEENNSDTIRNYLSTLEDHDDYRVIAFNISEKKELINQLNQIQTLGKIVGVVGTYNPDIFNLKFIDYQNLSNIQSIHELFADTTDEFDVFEYLAEQFDTFTHADLELTLLPFLSTLESIFDDKLTEDMRLGFLIHMGCLIDRLKNNKSSVANFKINEIRNKYPNELKEVRHAMKNIEHYFNISFSEGDAVRVVDIFIKKGEE